MLIKRILLYLCTKSIVCPWRDRDEFNRPSSVWPEVVRFVESGPKSFKFEELDAEDFVSVDQRNTLRY